MRIPRRDHVNLDTISKSFSSLPKTVHEPFKVLPDYNNSVINIVLEFSKLSNQYSTNIQQYINQYTKQSANSNIK